MVENIKSDAELIAEQAAVRLPDVRAIATELETVGADTRIWRTQCVLSPISVSLHQLLLENVHWHSKCPRLKQTTHFAIRKGRG